MSGYYLVKLTPGGEEPLDGYGVYEDGAAAARAAKDLSAPPILKIQPRRMRQAGNPAEIFAKRMGGGGPLEPMPAEWNVEPIPGHFLHLRFMKKGRVFYYENADHCILNRTVEMRPGTYLKKFYPELPDIDLRRLAALVTPAGDFLLATTEDEIEWVYENGPTSCMTYNWHTGRSKSFDSWCHPVRVYAAGDLAVAYRLSASGRVAERCLVWPDKMRRGRIYGDGTGSLCHQLEAAGYDAGEHDRFDGARLLRRIVEHEGDPAFICPYLDAGLAEGGGSLHVVDDCQFLRISRDHIKGAMDADQTNGLSDGFLPAAGSKWDYYDPEPKSATDAYREHRTPALEEAA